MASDFMLEQAFAAKEFNKARALAFGFKKQGDAWVYAEPFFSGRFVLHIRVDRQGGVSSALTDVRTRAPYVLHTVDKACGGFVGRVRQAYKNALLRIANACFEKNAFKSPQAKKLLAFAREKYDAQPEFLWKNLPLAAVLRCAQTGKWFGILMTLPKNKLGLAGAEKVEILDLRIDPLSPPVLNGVNTFAGYHMNKKTWFTVLLDGSAPQETLHGWLGASYALAAKKK